MTSISAAAAALSPDLIAILREEAMMEAKALLRADLERGAAAEVRADQLASENRALLREITVRRLLAKDLRGNRLDSMYTFVGGQFDIDGQGEVIVKGRPNVDPAGYAALLKLDYPEWRCE